MHHTRVCVRACVCDVRSGDSQSRRRHRRRRITTAVADGGAELPGAGRAGRGSAPVGGVVAAAAGQWRVAGAVGEIRRARTRRPTRRRRRR